MEDELEAWVSDDSEEKFEDTIDDTFDATDDDGVGNMGDDESDDD